MHIASTHVHMMGTVIEVQVEAERAQSLIDEAIRRLRIYEHRFSANDPASELGELNSAAGRRPVEVHPELFELISLGIENSLAPKSMLNIAIGPLVQLWRIGFADANVPDPAAIDAALQLTDPALIELDAESGQVFLARSGMKIDLGAVAKGYIADLIIAYFKDQGAHSAMINLGGNVLTFGPSPRQSDGHWRIGLRHPNNENDQIIGAITVGEQSVVTSGVYQRRLNKDGRTYHHILDPATGYPLETDVVSLTIVSPRSVDGEIWTSRLFGRSASEILLEISTQPECSALVITEDLELYASGELREQLAFS
ncbi:FAD:protein FMN transferase [Corynebacterium lubricantis]|uniref:FAD:protein FMN transferase n=1 Tax=Corynebacterium lubricantis TaxID=541095 RepID=UPI000476938D|nr:FAD:protein FMN transferase [Corynebacterium lubricantis]